MKLTAARSFVQHRLIAHAARSPSSCWLSRTGPCYLLGSASWREHKEAGYSTEAGRPRTVSTVQKKKRRELITLDATKIVPSGQRTYDISGYQKPSFKVTQLDPPQRIITYYLYNVRPLPFPPGSTGVFYYHPPAPGAPVLSGELRFKLCRDPAFFPTSPDLQLPDKTKPWSVNLYTLVTTPWWQPLGRLLVHEGLVSPAVVDTIAALPRLHYTNDSRTLYSLDQPFEINLTHVGTSFALLSLGFAMNVEICRLYVTRQGHALPSRARFELSALPEHAAQGPTLVLRVLELLTPIECHIPGMVSEPRPGELLYKRIRNKHYAWSLPLEKHALAPAFREFIGLPPLPADKLRVKGYTSAPRYVLTLHQEKMVSKGQEMRDISGGSTISFRIRLQNGTEGVFKAGCENISSKLAPFPASSKGALYYRRPSSGQPILSGQLRFRLCEDAATFEKGSDLLAPNGVEPWNIPLPRFAKIGRKEPPLNPILEEGLVEEEVVDKIAKLHYANVGRRSRLLHALDWPFVIDLSATRIRLGLINPSMFELVDIVDVFRMHYVPPYYAGLANVRFELSTLPEHAGSQVLVLRILELCEPVRRLILNAEDKMPVPQAGALLHRTYRGGQPKLWTYNLEKRAGGDAFQRFIATCEKS
ncbi:unnamed protein product [Cyclocybe aegerita]|uniref:Uncharacterized protein n=1 Tax=Cyclocybe aegerita TaxID=1973307 RepID=A0A8S0VUJ5_CYCAE|nr:unnamed protein product [Cyclocybe aegerita]